MTLPDPHVISTEFLEVLKSDASLAETVQAETGRGCRA